MTRTTRPAKARNLVGSIPFTASAPGLARELAGFSRILDRDDGETVIEEGSRPLNLLILRSGIVELHTRAGSTESLTAIAWPPAPLAPAAVSIDEPYLVSARTLGRSSLLSIDADRFRALLGRSPPLAAWLNRVLATQVRTFQRHILELKVREAPRRLGGFLLRLIESRGKQGCADLPVSKHRLASRLGMAPESVSRALRLLRRNGLVVNGHRAVLVDRARFRRFLRPCPTMDGRDDARGGVI